MMILALTLALSQLEPVSTPEPLQTLDGHARRGAVIARLDGLAAESAMACQAACGLNEQCQAWTWNTGWIGRAARCDIHAIALTPRLQAGATTGLAPQLSARINAAIDRAPTEREIEALDEAGGRPVSDDGTGLAGGGSGLRPDTL